MISPVAENLLRKLEDLDQQYAQLGTQLLDPAVLSDHRKVRALSIKRAGIESTVRDFRAFREITQEAQNLGQGCTLDRWRGVTGT